MNIVEAAKIGKALSDANRLAILQTLSYGTAIGCHLLDDMKITQPTFSHHMKILCECGLVNDDKNGKYHYYSINENTVNEYTKYIGSLTDR